MISMTDAQQRISRVGDAVVRFSDRSKATRSDFDGTKAAVFIHGYTADGTYMSDLMQQFAGAGFASFAFEYACYRGIDHAANSLVGLLRLLDHNGSISGARLVVVGHSMGGLVARAAVSMCPGATYIRKVITLGTPHDGALQGNWVPRLMAYWGEAVGGANPRGFSAEAESARQLVKADPAPPLLDRLQQSAAPAGVEYFSISGGYPKLDFGQGYWKNLLINTYLQRHLGRPNDGLVHESSSDLSRSCFVACAPNCIHNNSYVGYPHANHTFLVNNQEVALTAIGFAQ